MRQGIIFGIIISIFSLALVHYLSPEASSSDLDIIIMQNGEEIFSTPLLYNKGTELIWYVHEEDGDTKVLVDDEIVDYYGFDQTLDDLLDPKNIDYDRIYEVSGTETEINMIMNSDGGVRVYEANCPDKIDVKLGVITDTSKVITCAPHKLVIKLRSNGGVQEGELDG